MATLRRAVEILRRGVPASILASLVLAAPAVAQAQTLDLATSPGVTIRGEAAGDAAGGGVAGAGDVNGDGRPDIVIGAPLADHNGRTESGSAYVVFGRPSLTSFPLTMLGTMGFRIDGPAGHILTANDVHGAGDVNGDGRDDVIVSGEGFAYVVFGKATTSTIDLDALGSGGFRIVGPELFSVGGTGDFNADGKDDVVVGAPAADNLRRGILTGAAYVVFGKSTTNTVDVTRLGTGGVRIDGVNDQDRTGFDVAGIGDFSGDGRADVAVITNFGSLEPTPRVHTAYVILGGRGFTRVDLRQYGPHAVKIIGERQDDFQSTARAGDVNGDGRTDLLLGSSASDRNGRPDSGSTFVIFGKSGQTPVNLAREPLGRRGLRIDGASAGDFLGLAVAGAGDLNGDGYADLLTGSAGSSRGRANAGTAWVVLGRASTQAVDLATANAFALRIDGATDDLVGRALAGPGNVTGDGRRELLIGAPQSLAGGFGVAYLLTPSL